MSDAFKTPRQARSRATLNRMRAATEALLVEAGGAGPTVEEIVARAKTSVGAFYARFEGKDAAVAHVHEHYWNAWRDRWGRYLAEDRWEGLHAAHVVAGVIRHLGRSQFRDPLRLRAFWMSALSESSGKLVAHTVALDAYVADAVVRLLSSRASERLRRGERTRAREGFLIVIGAFRDRVMNAGAIGVPSEREQQRLIVTLVKMYASLVGVERQMASYADVLPLARATPRFPS